MCLVWVISWCGSNVVGSILKELLTFVLDIVVQLTQFLCVTCEILIQYEIHFKDSPPLPGNISSEAI